MGGAANEGLDAGQQLGEGEWLGQVIVAAGLEALDAVVHGGLGAEDEDGDAGAFGPELLDEAQAVEFGQHDVHDRGVVGDGLGHDQAVLAVGGMVHGVAALLQAVDNEGGNLLVVFHHQDAHGFKHRLLIDSG